MQAPATLVYPNHAPVLPVVPVRIDAPPAGSSRNDVTAAIVLH